MGLFDLFASLQKENDNNKENKKKSRFPTETVPEVLKAFNCKYRQDNEDDIQVFTFSYQNGTFVAKASDKSLFLLLQFPCIQEYPADEIDTVRFLVNESNKNSILSTFYYTYDDETDTYDVSICYTTPFSEELELELYFERLLNIMFDSRKDFMELAEKYESIRKEDNDVEAEKTERLRKHNLACGLERFHLNDNNPDDNMIDQMDEFSISNLVSFFYKLKVSSFNKLVIVQNDTAKVITDSKEIANFDIYKACVDQSNGVTEATAKGPLSMTLHFNSYGSTYPEVGRTATINVTPIESDNFTLYFRITTFLTPEEYNETISITSCRKDLKTFVFGFDKHTLKQKEAEAKFMLDDAADKIKAGKSNELTDEQHFIMSIICPNIAYNMYWGRKLFTQKRFFEAIPHLKNVYNEIAPEYHTTLNKKGKELFEEVCFYLGFCYNDMEMFGDALFYLSNIEESSNLTHRILYINCLCNSKLPYTIHKVARELKVITDFISNEYEDNEDVDENIKDYQLFIFRRYVYTLIDIKDYERAEEFIKHCISEYPETKEFMENELVYLNAQREADPNVQDEEDEE